MLTLLTQAIIAVPFFICIPIATGYTNEMDGGIWGYLIFNPTGLENISLWNHAPSLHVTYAFTIAYILSKGKNTIKKNIIWLWAGSVALSTMLVHEHHLICILGGFLLFVITIMTIYPMFQRKLDI